MEKSRQTPLDIIRMHQETVPVDVWVIARDLGIRVTEISMPPTVSGKITNDGASPPTYAIWLNASHHTNRKRFTLAHELAHYILHGDLFTEIVDNTMYRHDAQLMTMSAVEERHANQLAANILMPMPKIREYRARGHHDPRELAQIFGVSEQAMRIHIGQQVDVVNPRGAEFEDELEDN